MAKALGISDQQIVSLAEPASDSWDARLVAMVNAVDELVEKRLIGEDTFLALTEYFTENQLVEFCMLVGHYVMVAITINSCGLLLEPGYLEDE